MPTKNRLIFEGENAYEELFPAEGESVLDTLRGAGVYLSAPCGGKGKCGKCRVRVKEGAAPASAADERLLSADELAAGVRLACTLFPEGPLTAEPVGDGEGGFHVQDAYGGGQAAGFTPALQSVEITLPKDAASLVKTLAGVDEDPSLPFLHACSDLVEGGGTQTTLYSDENGPLFVGGRGSLFGIAIDIGTTTLAFELVDLAFGAAIGRHSLINKQRAFGGDVISRIVASGAGEGPAMTGSIRGQISEGVALLCKKHDIPPSRLVKMAIAGNTTMLHLLLGLSCKTLGVYPFTPVTLARMDLRYGELFEGDFTPLVTLLPGISTYVGADITAGLLFSGAYAAPPGQPALFVDIGTNGEMALASGGSILCTSTAAGPAFEGGNIAAGTGSVPGAIRAARIKNGALEVDTIGGGAPVGICGTGVIDVVAAGLEAGWIDPTGRYDKAISKEGLLLATGPGGDIRFTQKDVRELQFAKSALRTGIDLLIEAAGLAVSDIHTLYLAGGFGYHIDAASAAAIGLLPGGLQERTVTLGNSSLGGAVRALLDAGAGNALGQIIEQSSEFALSENPRFNDLFIDNSSFPDPDEAGETA